MTIEFKTADLIAAAQKVIDRKGAAEAEYKAAVAQAKAAHRAEWLQTNTAVVRALRDYLSACLRNGAAPDPAEIKKRVGTDRYGNTVSKHWIYDGFSDGDVPRPAGLYSNTHELPGLIELLKAHTGDTVTANQLRNLGFKSSSVTDLFRDVAAAAAAKNAKAKA